MRRNVGGTVKHPSYFSRISNGPGAFIGIFFIYTFRLFLVRFSSANNAVFF